jgi:hypothetical protein
MLTYIYLARIDTKMDSQIDIQAASLKPGRLTPGRFIPGRLARFSL